MNAADHLITCREQRDSLDAEVRRLSAQLSAVNSRLSALDALTQRMAAVKEVTTRMILETTDEDGLPMHFGDLIRIVFNEEIPAMILAAIQREATSETVK